MVQRCRRYVKFAGASTTSLVAGEPQLQCLDSMPLNLRRVNTVAERGSLCWFSGFLFEADCFHLVIMILRVYALYLGNKRLLVFLLCLLTGQVIVSGWAVHNGMREYVIVSLAWVHADLSIYNHF